MTYYQYDASDQGQDDPAWPVRFSSTYLRHDGPSWVVQYLEYDGTPGQGTVTYSPQDDGGAAARIEAVMALHRDRLCGAASLVLGAACGGEDVVQEACLRALGRSDLLRPDVDPLDFVRGFVWRVAQEELRRRAARSTLTLSAAIELDPTCEPNQPSTLDGLLHCEMRGYVRSAVQQLPDAQRHALGVLLDGDPVVEAASERDVSAEAVRMNQVRGRKALVRILRPHFDEP